MAFSIRLTEQEKNIAESYARLHSLSLGEAFKQALFEKIEDEYDLKVYEDAMKEYKADPVTHDFMDVAKELDLL